MDNNSKNIWWLIGAGIFAVLLIAFGYMLVFKSDRKAPEIAVADMDITYVEGTSKSVLLAGVTAKDNKDGDVTKSIIVESVVISEDKLQMKVCYVAKDKSNNISRAYRIVDYVANGDVVVDGEVTDGDGEKETSSKAEGELSTQTPSGSVDESQSAVVGSANPVLVLKANEATVKVGQAFNVVSYVADITDDKDDRATLYTRIIADGKCDTSTAGDYTLTVYCSDTDMNYSEKKALVVHVVQ